MNEEPNIAEPIPQEKSEAQRLLDLDEKWLQPFNLLDPFSGLQLEGFISLKPDHRYGALALLQVNGENVSQRIYATPKLHYPFNKNGDFSFPPIHSIDIYEKLDGTNILAYQFIDGKGQEHITYKLRLSPVLRNGKWGNFLDMWREMLQRYPDIPHVVKTNACSISFELYGSQNEHLIVYPEPLDCALLFGIDHSGNCRAPNSLETQGIPLAQHHGTLQAEKDPVAEYHRIRTELETTMVKLDEEKLQGAEGTVWYVHTTASNTILFKCKPESVEAIHWKGGISKEGVRATCWNLLEVEDTITYATLERLLLEEYAQADIDHFKPHIDACITEINAQMAFRQRVLDAYMVIGISLETDKRAVMKHLSAIFPRNEMKKVYSILTKHCTSA